MGRYLLRRLIQSIFVIWGTLTLVFIVLRFVGDPARLLAPRYTTPETVDNLRHILGLDRPLYVQYLYFLRDVVTGSLGESFRYHRPVSELIWEFLPPTLLLAVAATVLSVPIAIVLGVISATRAGSLLDTLGTVFLVLGRSVPHFWLGLVLIIVFAVDLGWMPPSGYGEVKNLIMPALTLAAGLAASVARLTRSSVLEVLRRDYVRTAKAKGLSSGAVLIRHVLPNALIPVVTMIGLQVAELLGGAITVEMVFAWPGIGWLLVVGLRQFDFPVIQGVVSVICVAFVLSNLVVDILYAYLDPRIRLIEQGS